MDEEIKDFLIENNDHLEMFDKALLELEKNPDSNKPVVTLFRSIHTIKGTCGFVGFPKLEAIAHAGEHLLSRLRAGKLSFSPVINNALLALEGAIRTLLASISATGEEGDNNFSALIQHLTELQHQNTKTTEADNKNAVAAQQIDIKQQHTLSQDSNKNYAEQLSHDTPHSSSTDIDSLLLSSNENYQDMSDSNIRVDIGLLDKLMNLGGELVLARNQIVSSSSSQTSSNLTNAAQRLNRITTELQEGIMKTRMQPIGNIWNKFPRLIYNTAQSCGKQVVLEMDGNETELDRNILEAIKDPLTHLVRNAVDHGIEPPELRLAAGKPQKGKLFLRAFHEGGQVNIEISDDGAGISLERIKQKALENNLVAPELAARMNERQLMNLIFLPGFSTADNVTTISGRGVGMDVVKNNIEKIGGIIDIQSKQGHGTTMRIKIPLTLAIIPALIVTCGGDRYAIPQVNLLKLVRLKGEQAKKGVERVNNVPVYRLRGKLLPLVFLHEVLQIEDFISNQNAVNIVVLKADEKQFGLVVDKITDTEEIVVKPLGKHLKQIDIFAGATIMGDGEVALILDVLGIAQQGHLVEESKDWNLAAAVNADSKEETIDEGRSLLLLKTKDDGRLAIPLSKITRLEEFKKDAIEYTGRQSVIQYHGEVLPLIYLSDYLAERRYEPRELDEQNNGAIRNTIKVVVHSYNGKNIGVVVDQIVDIVEEDIKTQNLASRENILYTVLVRNRVTEILDLEQIIRIADPLFYDEKLLLAAAGDSA